MLTYKSSHMFTQSSLDLYGKIIIGSRIINAIVLWSMCALPFAKLDAIVLLCTMVGSLIFQGN